MTVGSLLVPATTKDRLQPITTSILLSKRKTFSIDWLINIEYINNNNKVARWFECQYSPIVLKQSLTLKSVDADKLWSDRHQRSLSSSFGACKNMVSSSFSQKDPIIYHKKEFIQYIFTHPSSKLTQRPLCRWFFLLITILYLYTYKRIYTGYIGEFEIIDDHRSNKIVIELNGRLNKCGVISPRFDVPVHEIEKWIVNLLPSRQFGHLILSTTYGIMTHEEARRKKTGGKILGFFYWRV